MFDYHQKHMKGYSEHFPGIDWGREKKMKKPERKDPTTKDTCTVEYTCAYNQCWGDREEWLIDTINNIKSPYKKGTEIDFGFHIALGKVLKAVTGEAISKRLTEGK